MLMLVHFYLELPPCSHSAQYLVNEDLAVMLGYRDVEVPAVLPVLKACKDQQAQQDPRAHLLRMPMLKEVTLDYWRDGTP